jgi:cytoskeletal protein CcmA (bactofilin family)
LNVPIWKKRWERQPATQTPAQPERPVPATPQADFLDATSIMRASLGPDAVVNGRLSFSAPTRIEGTLRGEVRASDLLVIGETGFVEGTIRAGNLLLLGTLEGSVVGADRVEIGAQGSLRGSVETRVLVMRQGAHLEGDCRVGSTRASVHVLTPRTNPGAVESAAEEILEMVADDPSTGSG